MTKPKALVTRAIPQEALDLLSDHADMEVWPHDEPPDPFTLRQLAARADGILTNIMDRIDAELFDAAPNLKIVSQMAVGLDNIDVEEATRRRIPVGYTPGVVSNATADQAFALLLAAARRLTEVERLGAKGRLEDRLPSLILAWRGSPSGHHRHYRHGQHRPRNGQARPGLRHAHPLPQPFPQARRRGPLRDAVRSPANSAGRVGLREPPRAPDPGNPPPNQRRRIGRDEAHRRFLSTPLAAPSWTPSPSTTP